MAHEKDLEAHLELMWKLEERDIGVNVETKRLIWRFGDS